MNDYQAHQAFRHVNMPVWLMVGAFSGLCWRELIDLVARAF